MITGRVEDTVCWLVKAVHSAVLWLDSSPGGSVCWLASCGGPSESGVVLILVAIMALGSPQHGKDCFYWQKQQYLSHLRSDRYIHNISHNCVLKQFLNIYCYKDETGGVVVSSAASGERATDIQLKHKLMFIKT